MSLQSLPLDSKTRQARENFERNWVWRSVFALLDHQSYSGKASWLAEKLGISSEEAVESLEGLEHLGLVQLTEAGYRPLQKEYKSMNNRNSKAHLKGHLNLSQAILDRMLTNEHYYLSQFILWNRALSEEFYTEFMELLTRFQNHSKRCDRSLEDVYALSFNAVRVSKKGDNL